MIKLSSCLSFLQAENQGFRLLVNDFFGNLVGYVTDKIRQKVPIILVVRKQILSSKFLSSSLLISLILLFSSCKKPTYNIQNLNNNEIGILGHGGMGIGPNEYPMNSLESLSQCLYLGADGTEIDVQLTKDSIWVAFHPEHLEDATNHQGRIYEYEWSQIQDAIYDFPLYSELPIMRLDYFFDHFPDYDRFTYFLDCKNFRPNRTPEYLNTYTDAMIRLIDKYNLSDNVVLEVKNTNLILMFHNKRPDLSIFVYQPFEDALNLAFEYNLKGITISVDDISAADIQEAHDLGIQISVFNTHSKALNREAIEKNVDFIQTDKLRYLLKLL